MQSMAAACVKDQLPRIASISIQLRGEAIRNLRYELENLEHKTDVATHHALFLACFMLGLSAAWHDSQDLGLIYFETAKGVFQRLSLLPSAQSDGESLGTSFCEKSLVYWQMLMAPVCKDPDNEMNRGGQLAAASSSVGRKNLPTPPLSVCPVIPHPFTGLAESAQDLLTKVIALTRRRREPSALDSAIKLEEQISRLPVPSEDNIQDTLDSMSPSWHFQVGAEAYKNAGLLQLYNAFPELVESRLLNAANENQDSEKWLISLAVHTIDLLKRIPPSSGTRCTQPLVFIISAAGLKFPKVITRCQSLEFESSFSFEISPFEVVVARSRTFVLDRLTCFERNLPSKPISTAIKLVREVWRQMDDENEVCWMDVMVDNQLESLFG
ncbi:hypothetical protein N7462_003463 [Penicillium macrosclerotiorum]|uniref:uncharacterized protein n=1 Tax=Penicillium macrosclerotiorum TaxID=303699 RepID=UPI00254742D2|nr:uncharacterized protein N7462_003463 [Penicillium macrosclerotiorum]KAJ5689071.1 hypothetical protein N7462_003463 [Penicillium macrosclerotiorum]